MCKNMGTRKSLSKCHSGLTPTFAFGVIGIAPYALSLDVTLPELATRFGG